MLLRIAWMLVVLPVAHAAEGVFDWEDQPVCLGVPIVSGAIAVANERGTICSGSGGTNSVSNGTRSANDVQGLMIAHVEGRTFTPLSIDIAEYSRLVLTPAVTFSGHKPDGTLVSVTFDLDQIADGPGGADDFERFDFPASFENIDWMETGEEKWSFDNFRYDAVIPLPLPDAPALPMDIASSKQLSSAYGLSFVTGSDFSYYSDFNQNGVGTADPDDTGSFPVFGISAGRAAYDSFTGRAFWRSGSQLLSGAAATPTTVRVELGEVQAAGFTVASIDFPRPMGSDLLFLGFDFIGSDSYRLLRKDAGGGIEPVVSPTTPLPDGSGNTSTPWWFPDHLATSPTSYAFDTSLVGSWQDLRVFASFGGAPIQHLLKEGDDIVTPTHPGGIGQFVDLLAIRFLDFELLELIVSGGGSERYLLHFNSTGCVAGWNLRETAAPANIGARITGDIDFGPSGDRFLSAGGEIFREYQGVFHRVIGTGDTLGGLTLYDPEVLAVRGELPLRIIIRSKVTPAGPITWIFHQLELPAEPAPEQAPRFLVTSIHPETGDFYLPLVALTAGRNYQVQRSEEMEDWATLWDLPGVSPVQHIIIPRGMLGTRSFYRVKEITDP